MRASSGKRLTRRHDQGFTIVEVMMATFVLALGITAAIVTIQRGFTALDTARNTTLASQIIQSEMERIRLLSWSSVSDVALDGSHEIDEGDLFPSSDTTTKLIAARFTTMRTVSDVAGKAGEMKQITITVTWKGIDGISHTRTSSTQYCKNGLYDYYYTLARS